MICCFSGSSSSLTVSITFLWASTQGMKPLAKECPTSDQPVATLTVCLVNSALTHARLNHPLCLLISYPALIIYTLIPCKNSNGLSVPFSLAPDNRFTVCWGINKWKGGKAYVLTSLSPPGSSTSSKEEQTFRCLNVESLLLILLRCKCVQPGTRLLFIRVAELKRNKYNSQRGFWSELQNFACMQLCAFFWEEGPWVLLDSQNVPSPKRSVPTILLRSHGPLGFTSAELEFFR